MRPVFVLLWKYMKEKIRRPFHTFWEILSGVLVFVVILAVKQLLMEDAKKIDKYMQDMNLVDIAFAPINNLSTSLMSDICHRKINHSDFGNVILKCYGLENDQYLHQFITTHNFSMSDTFAAIYFHNLHGLIYPEKLEYEIEIVLSSGHHVSKLLDLYHIYEKNLAIRKNTTFFANLQWSIDKAYLERVTGQEIGHELQFHDMTGFVTPELKVIHSFLVYCSALAPLPIFMNTASRLVIEKRSGLKEMIKLVGVSRATVNISYFLGSSLFAFINCVLCSVLLKITSTPILPNCNLLVLCITLFLHYQSIFSLTLITSTLSQNYQHSDSLALLIYLMTFLCNHLWNNLHSKSRPLIITICCLLPHSPIFLFWEEVTLSEEKGSGSNFFNIWTSQGVEAVVVIWLCFIVQLVIIIVLSWYLDMVRPGKYGVAAKWNFFCKVKFWSKKKRKGVHFHVTAEVDKTDMYFDHRYFEKPPNRAQIAIKIANVSKVFKGFRQRTVRVLDNVGLNVYKGEITVLLGVNGAGKTTLLSIVTGMYSATEGTVYINGLDNSVRLQDLRNDLAYCPQQNLTFDYLTVRENLVFFQRLRGGNQETSAHMIADNVLLNLKLASKADYFSHQLSSGLRRCLQVGCVLVGDAEVLVLDEPTAGMDGPMRHNLWDYLLTLRKEKTIFMTTTVMDEADALGDRIALLDHGKLKCLGSPRFLKHAIGADFKVQIRLAEQRDLAEVKEKLEKTLEKSELTSSPSRQINVLSQTRLSVNLPARDRDHFAKVFDLLEAQRNELGISALDVGISMEQVFLRFVQDDSDHNDLDVFVGDDILHEKKLEGCELLVQQMKVLMCRVFTFVWTHQYQFIILQILVPFVAIVIITITSNTYYGYGSVFEGYMDQELTTVLYHPIAYRSSKAITPLTEYNPNVKFIASYNIPKDVTILTKKKPHRNVVGYDSFENHTNIYFRTQAPRKMSKAVNIFSNLFMSLNSPARTNHISMEYSSLKVHPDVKKPKNLFICQAWAVWISFLSIATVAPMLLISYAELRKGIRFQHLLAGCPPSVIWGSKLIAHLCIYVAIVPTMVVLAAALLDNDQTFTQPYFLLTLAVCLLCFGPACFVSWYAQSFYIGKDNPITVVYIVSLTCSIIGPILMQSLSMLSEHDYRLYIPIYFVIIVLATMPSFVLSFALANLALVARNNAFCTLNIILCPNFPKDPFVTGQKCCYSDGEPYSYLDGSKYFITVFIGHTISYWTLLLLLQHRAVQAICESVTSCLYKTPPKRYITLRVKREEQYVNETVEMFKVMTIEERQRDPDVILVSNLHKARKGTPIKGISFSIRRGDCLGIVGRNSSGKSTILAMLAGYLTMTRGKTCINGYFLHQNREQYLRSLCWVVTNGFDDFLSGFKTLELLACLYGYQKAAAQKVAMFCLQYMGLTSSSHTLLSSFSAGCLKRLSVCIALMGSQKVALLDESYASVDPHMKQYITRAILRLRDNHTSCIISEESMEWKEIDRICSRLAILDHGEIVALGSVCEVRKELASGYTANIKLKIDDAYIVIDEVIETASVLSYKSLAPVNTVFALKREFLDIFPTSVLLDEHVSTLYFHIRDQNHEISYSEMFFKLEDLKAKYEIIEDYTLSETSLEEVLTRVEQQLAGLLVSDERPNAVIKVLSAETRMLLNA